MMPIGGSETSGGLKDLRNLLFVLGLVVEFQFHDLAQLLGFGAVDRQHERFLQEGIFDLRQARRRGRRCLPGALSAHIAPAGEWSP